MIVIKKKKMPHTIKEESKFKEELKNKQQGKYR